MAQARRVTANVLHRGVNISRFIKNFSFTDNYDQTDCIRLTVADRDMSFIRDHFPETGEKLQASINVFDWERTGDNRTLALGSFEISAISYDGTATIDAVAVPITASCRSEKKNVPRKNIHLSAIAEDIAGIARIPLFYDTDVDPFYDVADQNDKSDLEFLEELCKSDGLCMKVTKRRLAIYEESMYEAMDEVATIERGCSDLIGEPRFRRNAKDVYKACEISHFDPKTDRLYTGFFEAPTVGGVGHTLRLREHFNSESDDMSLDRKAKARCREKNKWEWTCEMKLKGDIIYFSGTNVMLDGWHIFDGKYHIAKATHKIATSGGYACALSIRKCLEGY